MNTRDKKRYERQNELLKAKIKTTKYIEVEYSIDRSEIFFFDKTFWLTLTYDNPKDTYFMDKKRTDWLKISHQILVNHTMYCVISDIELPELTTIMDNYDYAKRSNKINVHRLD
jgi:hypothetical protein